MNPLMPLIEASLRGALLIGFLALLRVPLRRLIGSPWFCALWIVVLVRLMVPGSIQSSWSAFNWWPEKKAVQVESTPIEARVTVLPATDIAATSGVSNPATVAVAAPSNGEWLFAVWSIGAAGTMAMLGWRILKTMQMAPFTRPASNAQLLEAFNSIPSGVRRNVTLREVVNLDVPALVGLWRPQIWMPTSWLETMSVDELRHVLLHELGHARRGDLWVQWLFAFAQCIHWFNPAVWLAVRLAHADRELACDAWVLRRTDLQEPEQYGATLVKAAQLLRSRWHLPPAAITMAMSKASLFSRVRSIGQFQPVAGWRAVLGSIAAGLVLGSLATDRLHAQSGGLAAPVPPAAVAPAPAAGAPVALPPAAGTGAASAEGGAGFGGDGAAPAPAHPHPGAMNQFGGAGIGSAAVASPNQVEVEARFFQMPESVWKSLGLSDPSGSSATGAQGPSVLDPSGLHALLARINEAVGGNATGISSPAGIPGISQSNIDEMLFKGGGQPYLLSSPRVTTKSGQRAVIEIIREFRYPIEFDPNPNYPDGVLPTSFETRNVGVTLEVQPTVSPDGATVDLDLVPQLVELTGFTRVRDGQPIPLVHDPTKKGIDRLLNVSLPKDVVVQPIFSTRKITTSIQLRSGQSIVLGGLKQPGANEANEEPQVLVILVTARIITVAGQPVPAPAIGTAPGGPASGFGGGFAPSAAPLPPVPVLPPGPMPGAPSPAPAGPPGAGLGAYATPPRSVAPGASAGFQPIPGAPPSPAIAPQPVPLAAPGGAPARVAPPSPVRR